MPNAQKFKMLRIGRQNWRSRKFLLVKIYGYQTNPLNSLKIPVEARDNAISTDKLKVRNLTGSFWKMGDTRISVGFRLFSSFLKVTITLFWFRKKFPILCYKICTDPHYLGFFGLGVNKGNGPLIHRFIILHLFPLNEAYSLHFQPELFLICKIFGNLEHFHLFHMRAIYDSFFLANKRIPVNLQISSDLWWQVFRCENLFSQFLTHQALGNYSSIDNQ